MSLLSYVTDGLKAEAKTIPWTVGSVVAAWAVLWGGAWYFAYEVAPELQATNTVAVEAAQTAIALKTGIAEIQATLAERAMFSMKTRQCDAKSEDAKRFYAEQLAHMLSDYLADTGRDYALPTCAEIE